MNNPNSRGSAADFIAGGLTAEDLEEMREANVEAGESDLPPEYDGAQTAHRQPAPAQPKEAPKEAAKEEDAAEENLSPLEMVLRDYADAPPLAQFNAWKQEFGPHSIAAYGPSDHELFIFRPLRRFEHRRIAREIAQIEQGESARADPAIVQRTMEDRVLSACLLYPRADANFKNNSPFGLIEVLFGLIMEASHAIPVERAMQATVRL